MKKVSEQLCEQCKSNCYFDDDDTDEGENNNQRLRLYFTVKSEHDRCLEVLLKAGADVNRSDYYRYSCTPLKVAAEIGYVKGLEMLIQAGANVKGNCAGCTPLEAAFQCRDANKRKRCIELLLEAGAKINFESGDDTPLHFASQQGLHEEVDLLIQKGADVNKVNRLDYTPLMEASHTINATDSGHYIKCMELLIDAGADVNVQYRGNTALHVAAGRVASEAVDLLIRKGANVNVTTPRGSPLTIASSNIFNDSEDIIGLLIRAGADVNMFCPEVYREVKKTPLYAAITSGLLKKAEVLLRAGADVNIQNDNGNTALILVSMETRREDCLGCLKLLLRNGAKINIRNKRSENALQHCVALYHGTRQIDKLSGRLAEKKSRDVCLLLYAAGETLDSIPDGEIPDCLKFNDVRQPLKHMCREVIRKRLLSLDPYTHLFNRVPELGLPPLLTEYLLYDMSLDEDIDVNSSSGHIDSDDSEILFLWASG